jgi:hypothetical protein
MYRLSHTCERVCKAARQINCPAFVICVFYDCCYQQDAFQITMADIPGLIEGAHNNRYDVNKTYIRLTLTCITVLRAQLLPRTTNTVNELFLLQHCVRIYETQRSRS